MRAPFARVSRYSTRVGSVSHAVQRAIWSVSHLVGESTGQRSALFSGPLARIIQRCRFRRDSLHLERFHLERLLVRAVTQPMTLQVTRPMTLQIARRMILQVSRRMTSEVVRNMNPAVSYGASCVVGFEVGSGAADCRRLA